MLKTYLLIVSKFFPLKKDLFIEIEINDEATAAATLKLKDIPKNDRENTTNDKNKINSDQTSTRK